MRLMQKQCKLVRVKRQVMNHGETKNGLEVESTNRNVVIQIPEVLTT